MLDSEGGFVLFNDDLYNACDIGFGGVGWFLSELRFVAPNTETYQIEVSKYYDSGFCGPSDSGEGVTVGITCQ
jgi:hypothetical protein